MKFSGIKYTAVGRKVAPYDYNGLTLVLEYQGEAAIYENGKRLYALTSPIRRVSAGGAIADARELGAELAVMRMNWL